MTGQDIYKDYSNRIGLSYSAYVDPIKANRYFRRALNKVILKRSFAMTQKELDEQKYLVRSEKVLAIRGNKFHTALLPIENITVSGNVLTVTTFSDHNIISGDSIVIEDVVGLVTVPLINNTWTVFGVPTSNTFELNVTTVLGAYTPNSGIMTSDYMLTDYLHLYSMRCKSEKLLPYQIARVTQGGIVEFTGRGNLRDKDLISITNYTVQGLNRNWYVKFITNKKVKLYSDIDLTMPITSSALTSNTSGGVVKQVYYNGASPITNDQKAGEFVRGSNDSAKYETADGMIKIYPKEVAFSEVTLDYFSKPKIQIDANDSTIDLLLYYNERLLDRIIDEAVSLYSVGAHDTPLEAATERQKQINP